MSADLTVGGATAIASATLTPALAVAGNSVLGQVSSRPATRYYSIGAFLSAASKLLRRDVSIEEVGHWLGWSRATTFRRMKTGLTETEADFLACKKAHVHPWFIWGDWYDSDTETSFAYEMEVDADAFALSA